MKDLLARRLREQLPNRQALASSRWLRPVAAQLTAPELWRMKSESVARGVAVGLFWAFLVPVAQILFATLHCVWWRANIPIAAAITFVTNPLTVGGWLWLAYKVGSVFVGGSAAPPPPEGGTGLLVWLQTYGVPALVGMAIFGVVSAILGYLVVKLFWRLRLWSRLRSRQRRRTPARPQGSLD